SLVADAPFVRDEQGERFPSRQAAEPFLQSGVDVGPDLTREVQDTAAVLGRPVTGSFVVPIRLSQDGRVGQRRQVLYVAAAAVLCEQLGQGGAPWKGA